MHGTKVEPIANQWWWKKIKGFCFMYDDIPAIGGCHVTPLDAYYDDRGRLVQVMSEVAPRLVHCYYSVTNSGKARDIDTWHLHKIQTDRFVVVSGKIIFGLSNGASMQRVMADSSVPRMLHITPGVYHCFRPFHNKPVILLNFPTEQYNPDDELRVPFMHLNVEPPW